MLLERCYTNAHQQQVLLFVCISLPGPGRIVLGLVIAGWLAILHGNTKILQARDRESHFQDTQPVHVLLPAFRLHLLPFVFRQQQQAEVAQVIGGHQILKVAICMDGPRKNSGCPRKI